MIVQKDFLNKLKDFGLNTYESKLWASLLSRGVSTAGELSDIANVPRSRSYDVLESLEKKGFVVMKLGKPIKYIAVPPEEVLERVKKKVKEESDNQLKLIQELNSTTLMNELKLLYKQGIETIEPTELTGSIKGRDNIHNHLEFMIKNAQKSITIMTSEDGLKRKAQALKLQLTKAKQRGVKIRVSAPLTKANAEAVKELNKVAEVKNTNRKARFCIIDTKEITFMLTEDTKVHPSYDVAVWVNTPYFAQILESIIN